MSMGKVFLIFLIAWALMFGCYMLGFYIGQGIAEVCS